jgi:hypothetical protein
LLPTQVKQKSSFALPDANAAFIHQQMGWARHHIERLQKGETVQFRPRGGSMAGKIDSGQLCTVEPADHANLSVGDIVLCRVEGNSWVML